jgi:hypothetical protein
MGLIQFVQNYQDLSTDKGYQFKFFCDKCHNGYMSRFQTSAIGVAESALRVAGSLFGGIFNSVGNSAYEVQRAVGGPAHDAALETAVNEGKQHFHQCPRCGKWVCPDVCWNTEAGQCDECSPDFNKEVAAAHAHAKADAARDQLRSKAAATDYVSNIDMGAGAVLRGPAPPTAAEDRCGSCGAAVGGGRFCPQCGAERKPNGCPGCGTAVGANTRFCANCGQKLV